MPSPSPRLAIENLRFPLDSYLYHDSIGVVFVAIPKVGCSTIKRWLIAMTQPSALADAALDVHKFSLASFSLARLHAGDAEAILTTRPTVAFVREPVQRLRSAFIEKFVRPTSSDLFEPARELLSDWAMGHNTPPSDILDRRISFREFVRYVVTAPPEQLDPHWRPQADFLRGRTQTVLPLEHLSQSLDALARRLGCSQSHTEPSNVTRKEPLYSGCLADVPAGELHRANQRPPLAELADPALIVQAMAALAPDARLYQRARLTRIPWADAPLDSRYRDGRPSASELDRHASAEHKPGVSKLPQRSPDIADAPRDRAIEQ